MERIDSRISTARSISTFASATRAMSRNGSPAARKLSANSTLHRGTSEKQNTITNQTNKLSTIKSQKKKKCNQPFFATFRFRKSNQLLSEFQCLVVHLRKAAYCEKRAVSQRCAEERVCSKCPAHRRQQQTQHQLVAFRETLVVDVGIESIHERNRLALERISLRR